MAAEKYPQELLDSILDSVDLADIIDSDVPLTNKGKNLEACCPFHEEKTPSFKVNSKDQLYHCFGCGASGNAFTFVMEYHRVPFPEAVRLVATKAGITLPSPEDASQFGQYRSRILGVLGSAATYYQGQLQALPAVKEFLISRGVEPGSDIAQRFAIGGAPEGWTPMTTALEGSRQRKLFSEAGVAVYVPKTDTEKGKFYDRFRNGPIFPIRDERGRVVALAQRRLEDTDKNAPKYINGPETIVFKKNQTAYGLFEMIEAHRQSRTEPDEVWVTEGYMDVITSHQAGVVNTVGTMGTAATEGVIAKLYRQAPTLVFIFDGDKAGEEASQRALHACLPLLDEAHHARFVSLPQGEDPDSFIRSRGVDEYRQFVRKHAIPASDYMLKLARGNRALESIEAHGQYFANAKLFLDQMRPSASKALLMRRLEQQTGIRPSEYLPYSIECAEGSLHGVNLPELENEVREFIAARIKAPVADIKVSWSMPALGPRLAIENPQIPGGNTKDEIGHRMREVGRILSLESVVHAGMNIAQVLNMASTSEAPSNTLAQGLLHRYFRDTNGFEVEMHLAAVHLREIKHLVGSVLSSAGMTEDTKAQVAQWLANARLRAQGIQRLADYMDSGMAAKVTTHINVISEICESTKQGLNREPKPHSAQVATR